ncbi:hypothetical protein NEOLI_001391 [Neolecta irregularis DAH-3]|uniref:Uncharacterized protein n=1 Tax=Neolecta irregularis (strain DAH-3) TaxID=1198029 RepID=A0A1U7LTA0_NEOID|nr:hypothetical protein NEOLI_001391 [Neolecta irregularis DAH-3]|eukprot:OLL25874.1 hypothetical protein NEOLI_001391 [Neolecta irregularis DAH-3]
MDNANPKESESLELFSQTVANDGDICHVLSQDNRQIANDQNEKRRELELKTLAIQGNLAAYLREFLDRIDDVKSSHDRLELDNQFLQDYIGNLSKVLDRKQSS